MKQLADKCSDPIVEEDFVCKSQVVQDLNKMLLRTGYKVGTAGHEIYCICQRLHNPVNCPPMVGCESCEGWFHIECVGLSARQFKQLTKNASSQFFCDFCKAFR